MGQENLRYGARLSKEGHSRFGFRYKGQKLCFHTRSAAVSSAGGRFSLRDNGETPDTQDTLLEYPGFTAVWSHREACSGQSKGGLEFCGPRGSMTISRKGFVLAGDRKIPPENAVPQFTGAHPVGGPKRVNRKGPDERWVESVEDHSGDPRQQLERHVRNFLDCVRSREQAVANPDVMHRSMSTVHAANICMWLKRDLKYDPLKEEFNDPEANRLRTRAQREPYIY